MYIHGDCLHEWQRFGQIVCRYVCLLFIRGAQSAKKMHVTNFNLAIYASLHYRSTKVLRCHEHKPPCVVIRLAEVVWYTTAHYKRLMDHLKRPEDNSTDCMRSASCVKGVQMSYIRGNVSFTFSKRRYSQHHHKASVTCW